MVKKFILIVYKSANRIELIITIEDDGPGVPEINIKMFLNLFIDLDKSRSLRTNQALGWVYQ